MQYDELATALRTGVMCFPVTDFDSAGAFRASSFRDRLGWQLSFRPTAVFAAGGAGEFFSLSRSEYSAVVAATVEVAGGTTPVIASAGYGTAMAIEYAVEAERSGADGLLLLPPYLTECPQEGLRAHIDAVCKATRLAVIVYSRANGVLKASTVARLREANPNLVALKDGHGDVEDLLRVRALLGDEITLINGMPTAEVYAEAYAGMGIHSYSSAIFSFLPRSALDFYLDIQRGNRPAALRFIRQFLVPYSDIRRRGTGYAVSIVKAGVDIIGRSAGPVRPPLTDLSASEREELAALVAAAGPQI